MRRSYLEYLARLYGVDTGYLDVWGKWRATSNEAMLRVLRLRGAAIDKADDARDAIRHRRQECWNTSLEPVIVVWDGAPAVVPVRLPDGRSRNCLRWRLELEQGGHVESSANVASLRVGRRRKIEGVWYSLRFLELPERMPHGYHRLVLEEAGRQAECMVIVAPRRVYTEPDGGRDRLWGVFLPLYAVHRDSGWGAGDFSDLEALMRWTASLGGNLVATLPLLTTAWEVTEDPSPYNPGSRLFWNEFYLDPSRVPEFETCPAARALLGALDDAFMKPASKPNRLIDYGNQMRAKRRILELLCAAFYDGSSARRDELSRECQANPELESFARFRAVSERQNGTWPCWPQPLRDGDISRRDYDEAAYRYHLYTQWEVEQQLGAMTDSAKHLNLLWYLDFPLGVSGEGYDAWRNRELFVHEASAGAPPDAFFTKGQNWGFPPLHPETLRGQGYRYFIKALRNHLRHARVLRLDHVMGLHRFYWIPHGLSADDGAYVRYPMEESFAILAVESHRFRARIVGENLGTVPVEVDEALERHGINGMYILQYETNPDKGRTLRPVPAGAVASVNTHDMPQFAAYWRGLDIDDRAALGLFTPGESEVERTRRETIRNDLIAFLTQEGLLKPSQSLEVLDVLEACQTYLARSSASLVLVNLEDLWAETEPQNVPGTYRQRPNWRRRTQYSFETFQDLPAVRRILDAVNRHRRRASAGLKEKEKTT